MARPLSPLEPDTLAEGETLAYSGEVWTDGRGYATVRLPAAAGRLEAPLAYDLRDLDPQSRARVTGELKDGRFTIHTDDPHVKVGWRITGRRVAGDQQEPQQEEIP